MSFFTATSHQNRHPHRNNCDHWNHHDNRNHCDDCNHLNLQVQAANTGPAKYKGLTDVVFSLYRFAPFKFLIHLILCIIVVSIMTTTNFPLSATTTTITTTSSSSSWPPPCPPEIKRLKDKEEKQGGWSEKHLQRECCNCCKRSVPFFKSSVFSSDISNLLPPHVFSSWEYSVRALLKSIFWILSPFSFT